MEDIPDKKFIFERLSYKDKVQYVATLKGKKIFFFEKTMFAQPLIKHSI